MSTQYPKGAEWRKWDLHLHTPSSYDYKDNSVSNEDIIKTLEDNEISVVAISDHHFIDIERIRELQTLGKPKGITVLPGIEFLSDSRGDQPVHFLGIFSENCKLEYVWGQIQHKTAISRMVSESKKENQIYCNLIETTKLIHEIGGVVSVHAGNKHSSVETITNSLEHTMAQKTDIAHSVDIYELGGSKDQKGYKSIVFPAINKKLPMIMGSDNHNANNYQLKENCWLKADPTFEGLKQVINEPEARVFIGEKPPLIERISKHRTKYIKELSITQVDGYGENQGVWFKDVIIPFNSELVSIIGNKGSGKSAIADILSLCSNYHDDKDFSFLTSKKFREKNGKIAKNFDATLLWESDNSYNKNLADNPDETELLDVKYIPQGQFERLTNEMSTAEEFQEEIESVVFSHIPESERLGTLTFNGLIEKKTSAVESQLDYYKKDTKTINQAIIKLEHKATETYKANISNNLKKKQKELDALVEPLPIADPNEDPQKKEANEALNIIIVVLKDEIKTLDDDIKKAEDEKKTNLEAFLKLKTVKEEVQQKERELKRYISEKTNELSEFKINFENIISVVTDFAEIDKVIRSKEASLNQAKIKLGEIETEKPSLIKQRDDKKSQLNNETNKLDADQKQYQAYLTAKESWQKDRERITGDSETSDTLEYYNSELDYLENTLKIEIKEKYEKRRDIANGIFSLKQEVINIYKEVREKLNTIIDKHSELLKDYRITIDASLHKKPDFDRIFLDFILQNKVGTFHSKEGGEKQLNKIASDINFDKNEDVISFLDNLIESLQKDKREDQKNSERNVADQVKDIEGLYNYIFSLDFLDYNYQLKQGDKNIEQLSPGERGALLLVFYLLLDKNDIPLIIDQPEDNLDNHSVANILVPFIKAAKANRQIIMVTHNPNLAVVADAEQVIYVNLDKENKYTFSTISGSIENKEVNNKIVDVLEGAMPAFNTRKRKYYDQ